MEQPEETELLHARQVLRRQGRRMTGQRATLLKIIRNSDTHLDAEELYQRARQFNPRINRTTVYRNLAALRELGLIETLYLGQSHSRDHYERAPETEHYHFRCTKCGTVFEFESPLVPKLRQQVRRELGVTVSNTILSLEGTCPTCKPV